MGPTATSVEVPDGKMGNLVAEHLEQDRDRRHSKLRGQANHAAIEMDSSQRAAKPSTPFDSDALGEASEPPPCPTVPHQAPDGHLDGSATGGRHAVGR
jgi:hypothetical protein